MRQNERRKRPQQETRRASKGGIVFYLLLRGDRAKRDLGGKALTALRAAACDNATAILGRHTGAETMAALADKAARLKGTFHDINSFSIKVAVLREKTHASQAIKPVGPFIDHFLHFCWFFAIKKRLNH